MTVRDALLIASTLILVHNAKGHITFDCTDQKDGLYPSGCSSVFFRCFNGHTYNLTCPANLVFNPKDARCDYRSHVAICEHEDSVDCSGRADGLYGQNTCSRTYVSCSGGIGTEMPCPPDLFFDTDTKMCDYSGNMEQCKGLLAVQGRPIAYGGNRNKVAPVGGGQGAIPAFSCRQRTDGLYAVKADECLSYMISCSNEKACRFDCPQGLFFNKEKEQCDFKDLIPECNGGKVYPPIVKPEGSDDAEKPSVQFDCTEQTNGFYEIGVCAVMAVQCSEGRMLPLICPDGLFFSKHTNACEHRHVCMSLAQPGQLAKDDNKRRPHPIKPFDCASKPEGHYALANCKAKFVMCANAVAYERTCPKGLVYSSHAGACDYLDNCMNSLTDRPRPAMKPLEMVYKPNCFRLPDGAHAVRGCSQSYFMCFASIASMAICPTDLVFNADNGQCDFKTSIRQCDSEPLEPATIVLPHPGVPDPLKETIIPLEPSIVILPTKKPIVLPGVVEEFCINKEDGVYSAGCENFFYSCSAHKLHTFHCPPGLFFAIDGKSCEAKDGVNECNGGNVPVTSTPSSTTAHSHKEPVVYKPEHHCLGKLNGYYGVGCSSEYFACSNGYSNSFVCPSNLKFDADTMTCNYEDQVVACGRTVTNKPEVRMTKKFSLETTAKDTAHCETFCDSRPDGVFADGCAEWYFICAGHKTFKYSCPEGQKFNGKIASCDIRENVPECH